MKTLEAAFAKWRESLPRAGRVRHLFAAHCGLAETQLNLGRKLSPATIQLVAASYPDLGAAT